MRRQNVIFNRALDGLCIAKSVCRRPNSTLTDHSGTDPYIGTSGGGWLVGRGLRGQGQGQQGGRGNGRHCMITQVIIFPTWKF